MTPLEIARKNQEEWKKCPGCLCKGKCPHNGLEGCHIIGCAGRAPLEEITNKENKNGT